MVQPFSSSAGGPVGGFNRMWGGDSPGRYCYDSLDRENKGVDIGASGSFVLAKGHGPWAGDFDTKTLNLGLLSFSYFESPNGNWRGMTFGASVGLPFGYAHEQTTYSPLTYDFER